MTTRKRLAAIALATTGAAVTGWLAVAFLRDRRAARKAKALRAGNGRAR